MLPLKTLVSSRNSIDDSESHILSFLSSLLNLKSQKNLVSGGRVVEIVVDNLQPLFLFSSQQFFGIWDERGLKTTSLKMRALVKRV